MNSLFIVIIVLISYIVYKLIFSNTRIPPKPNFIVYDGSKITNSLKDLEDSDLESEIETPQTRSKKRKGITYSKDVGIRGEQIVNEALTYLDSDFYTFQNIKVRANRWLSYKGNKNLKSAEIDHVVIGPTGIYIIETKLWSYDRVRKTKFTPHEQVDRASKVLLHSLKNFYWTFNKFKIKKLVVSVNGTVKYNKKYPGVSVKRPGELNAFITKKKVVYSNSEIKKLIKFFR